MENIKEAIFAGGCFWGTEYHMKRQKGVISVESGFSGGTVENPTYKEVKTGKTGHAEVVKILYNADETDYEILLKYFMEVHDPTQLNYQGEDEGTQYRSEVFYENEEEKLIAEKVIQLLKDKGYDVVTLVTEKAPYYPAEDYHQNYYDNIGKEPSCHFFTKRF